MFPRNVFAMAFNALKRVSAILLAILFVLPAATVAGFQAPAPEQAPLPEMPMATVRQSPGASVIGTIPVGSAPIGIAVSPNANRVYVNNYGSNDVSVIDGQTDTVTATIPVGARPYWGVGISRSTGYVYVVNNGSNSVSVIDPDTSSVINTITSGVGSTPEGLAFNTRKNLLYVPHSANQVSVISDQTAGGSVVGTIWTNPYNHLMVVNEKTQRGYVSLSGSPASVAVLDMDNHTTLTHIPFNGFISGFGIALNETTDRVYVTHGDEDKLTVINGATNSIITQIATGDHPSGVAVNELNNHVYVTNYLADTLTIIDGATNTVIQTLSVGDGPQGVAVNPNTAKVYVANRNDDTVTVIQDGREDPLPDKFLFAIGAQAPVGWFWGPSGVAVASNGTVYVADRDNDRIQRFSATGQFLGKWGSLGVSDGQFKQPWDVAAAPDGTVYVADTGNDRIERFSATGQFLGKWGSPGSGDGQFWYPQGVAAAPEGTVYVADAGNTASSASARQASS